MEATQEATIQQIQLIRDIQCKNRDLLYDIARIQKENKRIDRERGKTRDIKNNRRIL